jgi:hypothetical protein
MTMDDFIIEDDLRTFEGWAKYQGFDPTTSTPEELEIWRGLFDEATRLRQSSPKVGLMKLQPVPGEQKYAVALRDGSELWLTMWVRCSRKGEIFIMYPRGDRDWDSHTSYHLDGTLHLKSFGFKGLSQKRQPLTAAFRGSEHLGLYKGHGKGSGAVCDPNAFDGVVTVEPRILGPRNGSVGFDLVEPGYELEWSRDDMGQRFYFSGIHQREIFPRNGRPSVVITIQR